MLNMTNEAITFSARFGGASKDIYVPINAVLACMHVKMDKVYSLIQTNMPMCK
jgi:stringent starvation protein B